MPIPPLKQTGPRLFFYLKLFAPIYFICIAAFRCYVESAVLSEENFFSYYLLSHHVLWFITSILSVMLFLHLYLKREVGELFWLFYGGSIIFLPILYSYLVKVPMNLEYFSGTFSEIVKHSLTATYTFPRNRPQFFTIIIMDIGIFIIGYLYTRKWMRAFITLAGTHFVLTIIGTKCFGTALHTQAVFRIHTSFSGQEYMSLIFLQSFSLLSLILLYRANSPSIPRDIIKRMLVSGLLVYSGYIIITLKTNIFSIAFDAITTAILPFTLMTGLFLLWNHKRISIFKFNFSALILVVVFQTYVILPLYIEKFRGI